MSIAAPFHAYRVARECVDLVWPQVEPLLARAIPREGGRFTTRDIHAWLNQGTQQLWVVTREGRYLAAGLMRFERHPTGKRTSTCHFAGGHGIREWGSVIFERWLDQCRLEGVTEMCVVGRPGWQKFAAPFGFKQDAVILRRQEVV